MSARERILSKLRQSAPSTVQAPPDVGAWFAQYRQPETPHEKIQRFRHSIELAHAEVFTVNSANWVQKLWEVLAARDLHDLLISPDTPHGQRACQILGGSGIVCRPYDRAIESWKDTLFHHCPASLTAARGAIAETGTLILWPDAAEPRLMSLVPPLHIVLLDAGKIYNTFYEAMTEEGWAKDLPIHILPTNALLISGPSKTADIQQTLAYGAHGPKELVVLLLEDNAP